MPDWMPAAWDSAAAAAAQARWDSIAKPLGSLGLLEQALVKIAGLTGDTGYALTRRVVFVLCADNGVVRQGVTQTDSAVTAVVARNMTLGDTSVCRMAKVARADVIPVDMGMNEDLGLPRLLNRRVAAGTRDMSEGPAMTRSQALHAVETGVELVRQAKEEGYRIVLTGEMGIGNTTTSAAVASVLLGVAPEEVTGRGAGLTGAGLLKKIAVIKQAIELNRPDSEDALDVLAKVGGFDLAGLAGVCVGGAMYRVPVLLDGVIACTAALAAARMCPGAERAMIASHVSAEPAGKKILDALGLTPMITAGMYLGEGTGAVAALPLLDMAYAVYDGMRTFGEIEIESYQPLK